MDAYIISYFGEGKLSLIRQALHYQQLCCLLQQKGLEDIYILSMDYQKHTEVSNNVRPSHTLYMQNPRIHYIDHKLVPPSQARNVLIDVFNSTRKPWALFADNDAYIDPRYQGEDCVTVIEHFADELAKHADVLSTLSPRHSPFKEQLENNRDSINTHLWLQRRNYIKTTLFFLRNRSRYGEKPVYFDNTLSEMEDFEYQGRILAHGLGTYQLPGVIMQDLGCAEEYSTLFAHKERTADWDTIKADIFKRYQPFGATMSNNKIKWNKMDKHCTHSNIWLPLDLSNNINYQKVDRSMFNELFEFV